MAQFKTAVITTKGIALMGKVMRGQTALNFSKICTSDTTYTDSQLANLTALSGIKQTAQIASVTRQNDATAKVSTSFSNLSLTSGYYVRTIGLYAVDPSEGDILYSVCIVDTSVAQPDYMPPYNGVGVSSLLINMVTTVGNADSVTVTVDPAAVATVSQITDLQDQVDDLKGYVGYMDDEIYGVEVDFKNKRFTRLAGAEGQSAGTFFDNLSPWGGRKRCMLSDDGYILGYYGDAWYTESGKLNQAVKIEIKAASGDAEAEYKTFPVGTPVQVMVKQPKIWVKTVPLKLEKAKYGRGMQMSKARFYVATAPKPGFVVPEVFKAKNGKEQDYIFLSAFEGSLYDVSASAYLLEDEQVADFTADTGDKMCSIAGAKPMSGKTQNLTRANSRALAKNRNAGVEADSTSNGLGWRQHDIFALSVSQYLMMVEFGTLDVKTALAKGVISITDDGASNLALVTGGTSSLGNNSGSGGDNDGKHSVSYRGEENLWGNIWTWLDGINVECKGIQSIYLNPDYSTWADNTAENYEDSGFTGSFANGYVSAFGWNEKYPYILFPTECSGASNLPVAAYHWQNHDYNGWLVGGLGGYWAHGGDCSPFCLSVHYTSGYRTRNIGGRLLYVPQADKPKYLYPDAIAA